MFLDDDDITMTTEKKVSTTERPTLSTVTAVPARKPYHVWTVGGKEYHLKLDGNATTKVESKYKRNIIDLITSNDSLPPLSTMLTVLQGAMLKYHHGVSSNDMIRIFDTYCEEGGNQIDLMTDVLMPTMAVSGFFSAKQSEEILEEVSNKNTLN